MVVRLVIGLALTVARRSPSPAGGCWWLLPADPRPASRGRAATDGMAARLRTQVVEVFGQRRLLKWTVPGVAHFLTFWGFIILTLTIIEAFGALFDRDFAIPVIGHWRRSGFLEDFFAVAVLVGIITFAVIRLRQRPPPSSASPASTARTPARPGSCSG